MNTLKKIERLSKRSVIDKLYKEGSSFISYPFRVTYLVDFQIPAEFVQVMFNISKKRFRSAVDRNLLKRRMREAYRLNKEILSQNLIIKEKSLIIAYNYIGNEKLKFRQIENGTIKSFQLIISNLEKHVNDNS